MATRTIEKRFAKNFRGLDLRDPDLLRNVDYVPEIRNAVTTPTGNLDKRAGYKIRLDKTTAPNLGLFTSVHQNTTTGATTEEVVGLTDKLYRRIGTSVFTVQYVGGASSATLSFRIDSTTATFKCYLDAAGTITSFDVGTGLEAVPTTLTSLAASIDALADYTATVTAAVGGFPAGTTFPLVLTQDIKAAAFSFTIHEWQQVNQTVTDPFDTYESNKYGSDFHNAHLLNYENCIFIATGYETLHKYDGQTVYRAGLPEATTNPTTALTGTGFTDTGVNYFYRYKQVDNRGNINFGVESDISSPNLSPANQSINVTVTNSQAGSGFNTNCALVNGNQVAVTTITVTASPHTLKVSDTAYFLNRSTSTYVTRNVTAVTATTITISGTAVNVNNADVISNNLRIEIYRNTASGIVYALTVEIPNNSFSATQVYTDATGTRGATFADPIYPPNLLTVKPRSLAAVQGVLCCAGDSANPNTVYLNDVENLEAFPTATHSFDIQSGQTGILTALAADKESLVCFKSKAVYLISGDIPNLNFRVQKLHEGQIGASSPWTVSEVQDNIIFLCEQGFYSIRDGFIDQTSPIGDKIQSVFLPTESTTTHKLRPRRAVLYNDIKNERLVAYIPTETVSGSDRFPNTNSRIFVFEYAPEKRRWLEWYNLNMAGGVITEADKTWFMAKSYASGMLSGYVYEASMTETDYDYEDHHEAIQFQYFTQWDDNGEPSVFKTALRAKLWNEATSSANFSLDGKTERDFQRNIKHSNWIWDFGTSNANGWGIFPWGIGPWGSPVTLEEKIKLRSGKHRAIRFVLENKDHNEKVSFSGLEYEVTGTYGREMKD